MLLEDYFTFLAPDDIRIKNHRLGIESVLYEYLHNAQTPEEIVVRFPTLRLDEVYATILYYSSLDKIRCKCSAFGGKLNRRTLAKNGIGATLNGCNRPKKRSANGPSKGHLSDKKCTKCLVRVGMRHSKSSMLWPLEGPLSPVVHMPALQRK